MRHVRMLGLCLVAVFAVAAIAATSASALPEWGQCYLKGAGGKYTDSNCQHKSSKKSPGEYEWRKSTEVKPEQKKFSGANVGSGGVLTTEFNQCIGGTHEFQRVPRHTCEEGGGKVESAGYAQVECESETNRGEATGTKQVKNVVVQFRGCKFFGTSPCQNTPKEGEIQVNVLKGTLGYINKATKEVGVLLEPAVKKGEFAKFDCLNGGVSTIVGVGNEKEGAAYSPEKTGGYDGIISPITPINTMTKEFTQVYTVNAAFENVPSKFEGKHIELLEDYLLNNEVTASTVWQKAGETITNVNKQESGEEAEIKA